MLSDANKVFLKEMWNCWMRLFRVEMWGAHNSPRALAGGVCESLVIHTLFVVKVRESNEAYPVFGRIVSRLWDMLWSTFILLKRWVFSRVLYSTWKSGAHWVCVVLLCCTRCVSNCWWRCEALWMYSTVGGDFLDPWCVSCNTWSSTPWKFGAILILMKVWVAWDVHGSWHKIHQSCTLSLVKVWDSWSWWMSETFLCFVMTLWPCYSIA